MGGIMSEKSSVTPVVRSLDAIQASMVSCYWTNHSGHTACLLPSFRPNIIELKFYIKNKGY